MRLWSALVSYQHALKAGMPPHYTRMHTPLPMHAAYCPAFTQHKYYYDYQRPSLGQPFLHVLMCVCPLLPDLACREKGVLLLTWLVLVVLYDLLLHDEVPYVCVFVATHTHMHVALLTLCLAAACGRP